MYRRPTVRKGDSNHVLAEALARWAAAGVDPTTLTTVNVEITDLAGSHLGLAWDRTIWIDQNADGYGWFVDATPWEDSEFRSSAFRRGNEPAEAGTTNPENRMDLLTVLAHELGHLLGYDHADVDDVMAETLAAGTRRTPGDDPHEREAAARDLVFAEPQAGFLTDLFLGDVTDTLFKPGRKRRA